MTGIEDGSTILFISPSAIITTEITLPSGVASSSNAVTKHSPPKPGVIAGAVIGSLLGLALIALISRYIMLHRRKCKREQWSLFKGELMVSGSPLRSGSTAAFNSANNLQVDSPRSNGTVGAGNIPLELEDDTSAHMNPHAGLGDKKADDAHA
jgi:hypothetical protein